MKRLLLFALVLLVVGSGAVIWLLRSEAAQLRFLHQAVYRLTGLQLVLEQPHLDLGAGRFSAQRLALYPPQNPDQPHINLQNIRIDLSRPSAGVSGWLYSKTHIDAVTLFASNSGGSVNPSPSDWINYLKALPDQSDIALLHLINAQDATQVITLTDIKGRRLDKDRYELNLIWRQRQQVLAVDAVVAAHQAGSNTLSGDISISDDNNNQVDLSGVLQGDESAFHYEMDISAQIPKLDAYEDFIVLQSGVPLAGAFSVNGALQGDQHQFSINNARVLLNNTPHYLFQATGSVQYAFAGSSALALTARGQLTDTSLLLNWIDIDLSALGQARAKIQLSGSIQQPQATAFSLNTFSADGLQIEIKGQANNLTDSNRIRHTAQMSLSGPRVALLKEWTGELPYDPGPWTLSGDIQQQDQAIALSDIHLIAGRHKNLRIEGKGGKALFQPEQQDGTAQVLHAKLPLTLRVADITTVTPLLALPDTLTPLLQGAQARIDATLSGDKNNWSLLNISGAITHPSFVLTTTGAVHELASTPRIGLELGLQQLPLSHLNSLAPQLGAVDGYLSGSARISGNTDKLTIPNLSLFTERIPNTRVTANAHLTVDTKASAIAGDVKLNWHSDNTALLEQLSTMALAPTEGQINVSLSQSIADISGQGHVGTTAFNFGSRIEHRAGQPQQLIANIHIPTLLLSDLGFNGDPKTSTTGIEQEDGDGIRLSKWLNQAPDYPLSLAVDVGSISGKHTRIDGLKARFATDDKRYSLNQFTVHYRGSTAELRAVIDHSIDTPIVSAMIDAQQVALARLLKDLDMAAPIDGYFSLRGGITAKGDKPQALLQSLNGAVSFALEDAVIEGGAYDLLATDALAWLYTGGATQDSTSIECAMATFSLQEGIASSENLLVKSPNMVATGKGSVNFHNDALNFRLTPYSTSRRLQVPATVKIKGTLAEPAIYPSVTKAAIDATAEALSLLPKLFLKAFGADKYQVKTKPCTP